MTRRKIKTREAFRLRVIVLLSAGECLTTQKILDRLRSNGYDISPNSAKA